MVSRDLLARATIDDCGLGLRLPSRSNSTVFSARIDSSVRASTANGRLHVLLSMWAVFAQWAAKRLWPAGLCTTNRACCELIVQPLILHRKSVGLTGTSRPARRRRSPDQPSTPSGHPPPNRVQGPA